MNRSREVEIARAKAMAEEYARSTIRPTRLRLTDLGTKSDELDKQIEELKVAEGRAKVNLSQAQVVVKSTTEANSKSQATLQVAQQSQALAETDLLKAEEAYRQAREWKAWFSTYYFANKEWTTQILSQAQAKLKEAQKTLVNQQGVLAQSVEAMKQAQQGLVSAQAQLELAQKNLAQAEAGLPPILKEREQLRLVQKDQYKEQARLQAVPTGIEKDYQPKLSALQTTLQEAKDALPPMVKAWESAKQKLAEASLPLEKQKAVWTESNKAWTELKQRLEAAEKAIAKAEKDIPQREQNLQEIAKNLATLEPQVEPLKLKVKEAEAKYLAMLPATPPRAQ
jgi:chromosome segregation ATPase